MCGCMAVFRSSYPLLFNHVLSLVYQLFILLAPGIKGAALSLGCKSGCGKV